MQNVQTTNSAHTNVSDKAAAILRAKLPTVGELVLCFEKRTGNFVRRSILTNENGEQVNKCTTLTDDEVMTEAAAKGLDASALTAEMTAKRAAATVQGYEAAKAKAAAKVEEAAKAVEAAKAEAAKLDDEYTAAAAIVEGFELPEKAERVTLKATVDKQAAEIERLLALLAAAGVEA